MRKYYLILCLSVLLFLFVGCDDRQEEIDALEKRLEEYAQYDELIDYIDSDSFDKAEQLIEAYAMQHNNEQVQAGNKTPIQINAENYMEYFEIQELTEWCKDDMGEMTGFITHVCVVLRNEYAERLIMEESSVDFRWQAKCSVKNCSVDIVNQIVSIENVFGSQSTTFGDPEVLSGTVSFDGKYHQDAYLADQWVVAKIGEIVVIGEYSLDGEMKPVCFDYEDTDITQAQGVLMLRT